ncbi:hypothetical protein TNIN_49581 [Trichonephila inaurata madagascariensis]|uniref:Uncharacterized protein n=1 Tax=Trichonephila inaurata madagascariensis TaxID=2747483 RepID=A0A8X6YWT5_9ARAC|nr:hypothetical protein TNIN_49581 [Trichonephila inaurata madagascariensis]
MSKALVCLQGCALKKLDGCLYMYAFKKDIFNKSTVTKAMEAFLNEIPEERWLSTVVIPRDEKGSGIMSQAFSLYTVESNFGPIYYLDPYKGKIATEMISHPKKVVLSHKETFLPSAKK